MLLRAFSFSTIAIYKINKGAIVPANLPNERLTSKGQYYGYDYLVVNERSQAIVIKAIAADGTRTRNLRGPNPSTSANSVTAALLPSGDFATVMDFGYKCGGVAAGEAHKA
jgi:hypothetical protein